MIEEPPLLALRRNFHRPSAEQLGRLAEANTGWLVDAQNGRGSLGTAIKPILRDAAKRRFHGTAVTCWCGPNDNLAILAALAVAGPGDVVIAACEAFKGAAVCGDLVSAMLRNKACAAFVTDGLVRDLAGLEEVGLPIFAAGINPNSCVKSGPGTVGLDVIIDGRTVRSGDLVFGDEDGVVTVPRETADTVLGRLDAIRTAEASLLAGVRSGQTSLPVIDELLSSAKVAWLD